MHNAKQERFSFLSDKAAKQIATPNEMAEYHLLLDEWGQSRDHNVFDDFFLRSHNDIFDDQ
jgi:hypothetical protein